jgi:hypothetical protein
VISHSGKSEPGTYTEWRVHGVPDVVGEPYEFVWSELLNAHLGDAEEAAKNFRNMIDEAPDKWPGRKRWIEGPFLSRRTVSITEWVDDGS